MARKTLGTRQKLVFRLPPGRPGNPFAATDKSRPLDPHGKKAPALPKIAKMPLPDLPAEEESAQ